MDQFFRGSNRRESSVVLGFEFTCRSSEGAASGAPTNAEAESRSLTPEGGSG